MWEVENNPDILCMDKDEAAEEFLCDAYGIEKPTVASSSPAIVEEVNELKETVEKNNVKATIDDKDNGDKEASNEGFEFSDNDSEDMGPLYSKLIIIVGGNESQEGQGGQVEVAVRPDSSTVPMEVSGNDDAGVVSVDEGPCNIKACWVRVEKVSQQYIDQALSPHNHDNLDIKPLEVMESITLDSDDNHSVVSSLPMVLAPLSLVSKPLELSPKTIITQPIIPQTTNTKPLFEKILENLRNEKIANAASAKKMRDKRRERMEKKEKEEKENGMKGSNEKVQKFDNLFNKRFTILGSGMKIGKKVVTTTVAEVDSTVDDIIDLVDEPEEEGSPLPVVEVEVEEPVELGVNDESNKWYKVPERPVTPPREVIVVREVGEENSEAQKWNMARGKEVSPSKEIKEMTEEDEEANKWCRTRNRDETPPLFDEEVGTLDVGNRLLMDQRERRAYMAAVSRGPRRHFFNEAGPRYFNRRERRRYDGPRYRERWEGNNTRRMGFSKNENRGFSNRDSMMANHNGRYSEIHRGFTKGTAGTEIETEEWQIEMPDNEVGNKITGPNTATGGEEGLRDGEGVIEIEDDDDVEVIDVVVSKERRVRLPVINNIKVKSTKGSHVREEDPSTMEAEDGEIFDYRETHQSRDVSGRARWFELDKYNRSRSPPRYCDLVENRVIDPPPSDNDPNITDRYRHLWADSDQFARDNDGCGGRKIRSYEDYEEYLARRPSRDKRQYQDSDRPMVSQVDKSFDVWRKYIEAKKQWKEHQKQSMLFHDEDPMTPPPELMCSYVGGAGCGARYRAPPCMGIGPFEPNDYYEGGHGVVCGGHVVPRLRYPQFLDDGDLHYPYRHMHPGPFNDHCDPYRYMHPGAPHDIHEPYPYSHMPPGSHHDPYAHQFRNKHLPYRESPPHKTDTPASPDPPSDHGNDFTMIPSPTTAIPPSTDTDATIASTKSIDSIVPSNQPDTAVVVAN